MKSMKLSLMFLASGHNIFWKPSDISMNHTNLPWNLLPLMSNKPTVPVVSLLWRHLLNIRNELKCIKMECYIKIKLQGQYIKKK